MLNVLLIILLLAFLTGLAGLSLVLGAFLAGMLISETEYRFQVEEDIKPFRDVLLGLFFVTVGMLLDLRLVAAQPAPGRAALHRARRRQVRAGRRSCRALSARRPARRCASRSRSRRPASSASCCSRSPASAGSCAPELLQPLLAAMVLSMLAAPFLIARERPHRACACRARNGCCARSSCIASPRSRWTPSAT